MTTWPSGTKASTNNLDAGTDKPRLARPDIKQNVDNVNDIIDYFNVSSAADGDILVYNSSTNKIELNSSNSNFTNLVQGPKETINAIGATSGSVDVDAEAAPVHTMTLNDDTTYTFTNMVAGTSVLLIIKINATEKTATFTSDGSTRVKFPGGAPTLTVTSGNIDLVNVFFDGTDYIGNIIQRIS
tara:strand:+ start:2433 stop:2987 length:555 start_codon:yes stop_codon:yes gene_type:complete